MQVRLLRLESPPAANLLVTAQNHHHRQNHNTGCFPLPHPLLIVLLTLQQLSE